LFLLPQ